MSRYEDPADGQLHYGDDSVPLKVELDEQGDFAGAIVFSVFAMVWFLSGLALGIGLTLWLT